MKNTNNLLIFDLNGTLFEGALIACPETRNMGDAINEKYLYTMPYQDRLRIVADRLNQLLDDGNEIAVVSNHHHTIIEHMMLVLNDIEQLIADENKGKIMYFVTSEFLNKEEKKQLKGSIISCAIYKIDVYKSLDDKYPEHNIIVIDDNPQDELTYLLEKRTEDKKISSIIIRGNKTASPWWENRNDYPFLFTNNDSIDNIIEYYLELSSSEYSFVNLKKLSPESLKKEIDQDMELKKEILNVIYLIRIAFPYFEGLCSDLDFFTQNQDKINSLSSSSQRLYYESYKNNVIEVCEFEEWYDILLKILEERKIYPDEIDKKLIRKK